MSMSSRQSLISDDEMSRVESCAIAHLPLAVAPED